MQKINGKIIEFWIDKINGFLRQQNFKIDPLPKTVFVDKKQKENDIADILISTGGYEPMSQTLFLYIDNRHLKDILRSYCHEIVHHHQWLDNPDYIRRVFAVDQDDIAGSKELEDIEGEAYLNGNLMFRKFTEQFKKQQKERKVDNDI